MYSHWTKCSHIFTASQMHCTAALLSVCVPPWACGVTVVNSKWFGVGGIHPQNHNLNYDPARKKGTCAWVKHMNHHFSSNIFIQITWQNSETTTCIEDILHLWSFHIILIYFIVYHIFISCCTFSIGTKSSQKPTVSYVSVSISLGARNHHKGRARFTRFTVRSMSMWISTSGLFQRAEKWSLDLLILLQQTWPKFGSNIYGSNWYMIWPNFWVKKQNGRAGGWQMSQGHLGLLQHLPIVAWAEMWPVFWSFQTRGIKYPCWYYALRVQHPLDKEWNLG